MDSSILVGTGLDDGLDAPWNESQGHHNDGNTDARRRPRGSDSATSAGQLPDLQEGSSIVAGTLARNGTPSWDDSHSGYADGGMPSAGAGFGQWNSAEPAASLGNSLSSADPASATTSSSLPSVAANSSENSSSPATSTLSGTRAAQSVSLGFTNGLAGWNIRELGGSAEGKGTVTAGSAILREGDSFLVTLGQDLIVPQSPISLSFTYEAMFDTADPDSINDAFEATLMAADGSPLVYSFAPERDAFFNVDGANAQCPGSGNDRGNGPRRKARDNGHFAAFAGHKRHADVSPGE